MHHKRKKKKDRDIPSWGSNSDLRREPAPEVPKRIKCRHGKKPYGIEFRWTYSWRGKSKNYYQWYRTEKSRDQAIADHIRRDCFFEVVGPVDRT
jgi:hypothetical protein